MNAQQIATAAYLSRVCADYCNDGNIAFRAEEVSRGSVYFEATNVLGDLRWFEKTEDFRCFIGPRGGIRMADGTLARWVKR